MLMPDAKPFTREAGSGPGVVCIHANASNSAQWRGLMDLLSPTFRVIAPDLYGSGKSVDWPPSSLLRCCRKLAIASHWSATHTEERSHCWPR
ncbi:MAG: alpha/beta fold hydrolase [Gemmatimonadota bacterium]